MMTAESQSVIQYTNLSGLIKRDIQLFQLKSLPELNEWVPV